MEKNSLLRHQVDWPGLRSKAFSQACGALKPTDTYGAINSALHSLSDGHSTFWEPEKAQDNLGSPEISLDGLQGRSLKMGSA
ncbi:hypothetical protein ACOBQB_01125 [Streptomyces sp. G5(2025)]|uniref:hypothetical protein n=1 Tax=Streptomyces sp. G5(2025) TaxID=3406628 RepID=UPI003C177F85